MEQEHYQKYNGQELRISCITWNLAECQPPNDLNKLFNYNSRSYPDIIALSIQEISLNVVLTLGLGEDVWAAAFIEALKNPQENYILIKTIKMWNMQLFLFCRIPWIHFIHDVDTSYCRTNYAGLLGSKGAVSIRLEIGDTTICFINSHFSAHMHRNVNRIQDFDDTVLTQTFEKASNVLDHDYVFWSGDLNFRLEGLKNDEIKQLIQQKNFKELLKKDQLKIAIEEKLIFLEFQEGPINFAPTYKFDINSDVYDTSLKQRLPAYTDRILSLMNDNDTDRNLKIMQTEYSSNTDTTFQCSDHRPVYARFSALVYLNYNSPIKFTIQPIIFGNVKISYLVDNDRYSRSSWDWIALYDITSKNLLDYKAYIYAPSGLNLSYNQRTRHIATISLPDDSSGFYFLAYWSRSKDYPIVISEMFKVANKPKLKEKPNVNDDWSSSGTCSSVSDMDDSDSD